MDQSARQRRVRAIGRTSAAPYLKSAMPSDSLTSTIRAIEKVASTLVGESIPRPAGSLAGHSAALPFEQLAHSALKQEFGQRVFRQYELLNHIFTLNPEVNTFEGRSTLLGPLSLQKLLARGKTAMAEWSLNQPFVEKQNDTAESVILPSKVKSLKGVSPVILIDIKTKALDKRGQPPNIMSADKVANLCKAVLEDNSESDFQLVYLALGWREQGRRLQCIKTNVVHLNRIRPETIYINWVAAQQIQFDPFEVDQSFHGTGITWAKSYLQTYCDQLEIRVAKQVKKIAEFRAVYASRP